MNQPPPHFLIVGAMKAGTTTLYRDLVLHPDIFMPTVKEPEILIKHGTRDSIAKAYEQLFGPAKSDAIMGEASTAYTKRPVHEGVADLARKFLSRDLKVIYIRREPISRLVSQYSHEQQHGTIDTTIKRAIRECDRLIDFGRYDWQIAPWQEAFGSENVLQLELAEYASNRQATVEKVLDFIGASIDRMPQIDTGVVANRSDEAKIIENRLLAKIVYSDFYQHRVKLLISGKLREKLRHLLLPKPERAKETLDEDDISFIRKQLAGDPPGTSQKSDRSNVTS